MTALAFALGALASWRLASLVADDEITVRFRRAVGRRWWRFTEACRCGHGPANHYLTGGGERRGCGLVSCRCEEYDPIGPHPFVVLVNCVRCLGVWTSGAVFAAMWAGGLASGGWAVLGAGASAAVVALLARLGA